MTTGSGVRDGQLAEQVREGDSEALGVLYDRHAPATLRRAYHITGSRPDAEDLVHDLFLALPQELQSYEDRDQFPAWLGQVVTRAALKELRRWRRRREIPIEFGSQAIESAAEETEILDAVALEQVLLALPDKLRVVFVLKKVEGYPHAEIAKMLGITVATSEKRLSRAMATIEKHMGSET